MTLEGYLLSLRRIRRAYLFILFDINLMTIDLLPNWLGFLWIYLSLDEIGKEEKGALLLKNLSMLLTIYSFISWIMKMLGFNYEFYIVFMIINILTLYLNFSLMTYLIQISKKHQSTYSTQLIWLRNILTVIWTALAIIKVFGNLEVISISMVILYLIISFIQIIVLSFYIEEEKHGIY